MFLILLKNIFFKRIFYIYYHISNTCLCQCEIVEEEWGWDVDTMSYIDLRKVIKSIGYKAFKCLWYKHPQKALCRGLKQLNCDSDIL